MFFTNLAKLAPIWLIVIHSVLTETPYGLCLNDNDDASPVLCQLSW